MMTDKQCEYFINQSYGLHDMVRMVFNAGFIKGSAEDGGAIGEALKELETAVRADAIGCIREIGKRDEHGRWLSHGYISVRSALSKLDKIRDV